MPRFRLVFAAFSASAAVLAAVACGDDDNTVRLRPDAGASDASAEAGTACGVAVPTSWESPSYATNAAAELGARAALDAFTQPMKDVESRLGDGGAPDAGPAPSQSQLAALFVAGSPSLRSITTDYFQGKVDGWLQEYEAAATAGAWSPSDPPPAKGGAFGKYVVTARGIDVRQAVEKGLYNAAFYNHAVKLAYGGAPTEATLDRLVAAFGAHPAFANDPAAATNKDVNAAGYAARRDSKDPASPGPYQRAKRALLVAKASVAAGEKCNADRDAALKVFFLEWEKSQYATVVFYFTDIKKRLAAAPLDAPAVIHAHSEGIGFLAGFRTIDPAHRKITDAQIDDLLAKSFAPNGAPAEAYKVLTATDAAAKLDGVITDLKGIYGFSDAEMTSFEKNF